MSSNRKITQSIESYWDRIKQAAKELSTADYLLIGGGSGLSAAGGLNYADPELAKRWFPQYYAKGFKTILDIQGMYWRLQEKNISFYWGYWAKHIDYIRYKTPLLEPYGLLYSMVQDKKFFICTTNADGQFQKAGFSEEHIFAPQGNYAFFQCSKACSGEIYPNQAMIDTMLANMPNPFEVREQDIPKCPRCKAFLIPNLRIDRSFVEKPHMEKAPLFEEFLEKASQGSMVLLELGVGFNTPGIIRYPFEQITFHYPKARMIRVNRKDAAVPDIIKEKAIGFQADIRQVLRDIDVSMQKRPKA